MLNDPHRAVVPRAIVDAAAAFAARATAGARPQRAAATLAALGRWRGAVPIAAAGTEITEELVTIDDRLVAIVAHPPAAHGRPPRRAVVMLNAGAIHHVGPNRLYVTLARRLAATGVLAVRVDLSGLGDSPPRPGAAENVVYGEHAIRDIAATVAWVRARGAAEVAIVGLCSGAYHALKAAVTGVPIDTIVPINPLTFFYAQGMPLDFAAFRVAEDTARYAGLLQTVGGWRKLVRGDFDVSRAIHVLAERARTIAVHRARDFARQLRVPLRNDLGSELAALAARGVAMRFVFAGDDPGLALLEEQGGSIVRRLAARGALAIDVIAGADHTFTPRWSHAPLTDAVARAVLR
jgi:alpha/beta superfamily hydrolase